LEEFQQEEALTQPPTGSDTNRRNEGLSTQAESLADHTLAQRCRDAVGGDYPALSAVAGFNGMAQQRIEGTVVQKNSG
jgi:hypothetical protein